VIEILKRSILISGMAIFGQLVPGAELLTGTLLSVVFCLEQCSLQPYLKHITNKTKIWVDVVVTTTMLSMLTLTVDTNEYDKGMVDWLIGVTNFFLLCVVLWFSWQTLKQTILEGPAMVKLRIKGAKLPHPTDQLLWLVRVWRIVRRLETVYLKSKAPPSPTADLKEVEPTEGSEERPQEGGSDEAPQSEGMSEEEMAAWISHRPAEQDVASPTTPDSPSLLPGTFVGRAATVQESVQLITSALPPSSLSSHSRSRRRGTSETTMETVAAALGAPLPQKDSFRRAQNLVDFLSSRPGVTGVSIRSPTEPQQEKSPPPPSVKKQSTQLNVIEDLVASDPVFRRWQSVATIKKTRGVVKSVSSWRPTSRSASEQAEPLEPVAERDMNEAMQAWEEEVARAESEHPVNPPASDQWITELNLPELDALVTSLVGVDSSSPTAGDAK